MSTVGDANVKGCDGEAVEGDGRGFANLVSGTADRCTCCTGSNEGALLVASPMGEVTLSDLI